MVMDWWTAINARKTFAFSFSDPKCSNSLISLLPCISHCFPIGFCLNIYCSEHGKGSGAPTHATATTTTPTSSSSSHELCRGCFPFRWPLLTLLWQWMRMFCVFVRYFTRLQTALKTTTKDKLFALLRQHNFVMIDFFVVFLFDFFFDGRRRFFAHKLFSLGQFNNFFVSVLWFSFVCHAKISKPNANSVVGDWFCPLRVLISLFCAENKEITRFFRKNLSENKQQIILFNERMTAQSKLHEWMTVQSTLSKN